MKRSFRAIATIAETPSKRKKVAVEFTKCLSSLAVEDVPSRLIQPPEVLQLVSEILDEPHKDSAPALTSFFYTVASPYALRRLHEACLSVRNSQTHEPFFGDVDVRHSMRALDNFEMHEHIYPILRRYYLVQLGKCKDTLQKEKLKSLSNPGITSLKRTLRKKYPIQEDAGTKLAAGLAFEELMIQAYPKYKQETRGKTSQWAKRIKNLRNRLSAGQNWNVFQK